MDKLGLVLGRFQPLHPGHLMMIDQALRENDQVIVCIGSAQRAEPFSIEERVGLITRELEANYPDHNWRVVPLTDPEPIETWVPYTTVVCGITDQTDNTFYRGEALPAEYVKELEELGFKVKILDRTPFFYKLGELYYKLSSATEIKALHHKLGIPLKP